MFRVVLILVVTSSAFAEPLEQRGNAEVVGTDVIQRAEPTVERVIVTFEGPGSFEREDIGGLLDDAEQGAISGGIFTDEAAGGEAGLRHEPRH